MCCTGGVCGAVSKVAAGMSQAWGVCAMPVGQPGHCAYIWQRREWINDEDNRGSGEGGGDGKGGGDGDGGGGGGRDADVCVGTGERVEWVLGNDVSGWNQVRVILRVLWVIL